MPYKMMMRALGRLPECCAAHEQVGDASASQSPLSFGGFGSMLRHLRRLADGLDQALTQDKLSRGALKLLQVGKAH